MWMLKILEWANVELETEARVLWFVYFLFRFIIGLLLELFNVHTIVSNWLVSCRFSRLPLWPKTLSKTKSTTSTLKLLPVFMLVEDVISLVGICETSSFEYP